MLTWNNLTDGISLVKERSNRTNRLNSLIIEDHEGPDILIDSNYPFDDIDQLYSRIDAPAKLLCSHGHLDHTAHAFYHLNKYKTQIVCPIQEKDYLTNFEHLLDIIGFKKLNLDSKYRMMTKEYMKFSECEEVSTFSPGKDNFQTNHYKIESIHIPGHSPGHTAFSIQSFNNKSTPILFVSDIGSHPYYGDLNSNLTEYRNSIDKLEKIYLSKNYFLIPAHGNYYLEREDDFFERIRQKINKNKKKILASLKRDAFLSIKELVEMRILTPPERIFQPIKDLYYLWDGGMILNHMRELLKEDKVQEIKDEIFLQNKYKLK
jgi:glyoxylase-like metal-dependent hydrolase (beta-lactamase superfamily II)